MTRTQRGRDRLSAEDVQRAVERAAPLLAGEEGSSFDDALHAVVTHVRPREADECGSFLAAVGQLVRAAGDDADHWKMLVLALIRRRYHARAPEARAADADEEESGGDGERLLFYLAIIAMQAASQEGHPAARAAGQAALQPELGCTAARAAAAASVLCRAAPLAGGTRDICHLIEHLGMQALHVSGTLLTRGRMPLPPS